MQIFDSIASLDKIDKGLVLTIGNFDGVHLGHQKIIAAARREAKKLAGSSVAVMTFDPHPVAILHPEKAPGMLTPLGLKKHLLETLGTDCLIILKDSYQLLNLSPKDFVGSDPLIFWFPVKAEVECVAVNHIVRRIA